MEEILDPIHNYLFSENPDYSLMINGEWGSGKSHFIENILQPKYKDQFNFIYCSAYGLKTTEDLVRQISVQKNPVLRTINNSKALRIGTSLASSLLRFALPMIKVGTDLGSDSDVQVNAGSTGQGKIDLSDFWRFTETDVIIIDDIERTILETNEIFGFVSSSFLNPRACKVILICSESELIKKDQNYLERKEKIVRHTIPFEWNSLELIPSIIEATISNKDYRYFLLSNCQPFLIQALEIVEGKNLRKYGFFLSIVDQLSKYVSISDFKICHKSLMQSIFVFSIEYIEGNLNMYKKYDEVIIDNFLRNIFSTAPGEKHRYEPVFDVYNRKFIHAEQVYNLIVRGFVEEEKIEQDINQFALNDNPENDWSKVLDILSRFEKLSKDDFVLFFRKSLEYLDQNKYTNYELCELGITYATLLDNNVISHFKDFNEIDNSLVKHFKDSNEISEFNRSFYSTDTSPYLSEFLPQLHKAVSDYHIELKKERFHKISQNYFEKLKNKDQSIKTETLEDILNNGDQRLIELIVDIYKNNFPLSDRINNSIGNIKSIEKKQIDVLQTIVLELDKYYVEEVASLGLFHYKKLKTTIKNLIEKSMDNK